MARENAALAPGKCGHANTAMPVKLQTIILA
jgi:hypothetical protein